MCDGNIVYQGEARKSAAYFKNIGIPCPTYSNPADFFMRALTINYPKTENDIKKIDYISKQYEKHMR